MKRLTLSIILLAIASQSFAWTYYGKNKSPSYLRDQGNIYKNYNAYSTTNNNNPYSTFQSVYDNHSGRNDQDRYGHPVKTPDGKSLGHIGQQNKAKNSIANPYGQHGTVYQQTHPSVPYQPQKWDNPYSKFQSPYHGKAFRNDPKWGQQYHDSHGRYLGSSTGPNSVVNSYNHSPFNTGNTQHPYSQNKVFD